MFIKDPKVRRYIYTILLALQPLAVAYGVVNGEEAVMWVNALAAVLGLGLAAGNTSNPLEMPDGDGKHRAGEELGE